MTIKTVVYRYKGEMGSIKELWEKFGGTVGLKQTEARVRKDGMSISQALETPRIKKGKEGRPCVIDGISATINQHCRRIGIVPANTAHMRIAKGMPPSQACKMPVQVNPRGMEIRIAPHPFRSKRPEPEIDGQLRIPAAERDIPASDLEFARNRLSVDRMIEDIELRRHIFDPFAE